MKRTLFGFVIVVLLVSAAFTAPALATKDSSTLRYTMTKGQSAEIPLGEAFADDIIGKGRKVGLVTGTATVVYQTEQRLIATISGTIMLPEGTLTYAGVNDENPAQGPTEFTFAITGGTERYRGASGEGTARFLPNTNTANVVIHVD
jgi:Allene oxide cyclase barrel like domain